MSTLPLVSAIIPTYNRELTIGDAVDSILAQTYPRIEIIVIDDGSIDGTQARLAQYGTAIRVVLQSNSGPAAARNRGIAMSKGELVAFLDSDDIWLPTKVERQVDLMERAGAKVPCCVCNIMMCWSDKEMASFNIASLKPDAEEGLWLNAADVLATRFLLFNQGVMIRREVLHEIGGFDESLWLLEDHDLALRLSLKGPWGFIQEPLVRWRESKSSLYKAACKDETRPAEALVRVLESHIERVYSHSGKEQLLGYLKHELDGARRQLQMARTSQTSSRMATASIWARRLVERYRRSIYIRSRNFPAMKVEQLPADSRNS